MRILGNIENGLILIIKKVGGMNVNLVCMRQNGEMVGTQLRLIIQILVMNMNLQNILKLKGIIITKPVKIMLETGGIQKEFRNSGIFMKT
jgi:poly(A) polymerase Pap1